MRPVIRPLIALAASAGLLLPGWSQAQQGGASPGPEKVALTIYRDGPVQETDDFSDRDLGPREIDLSSGLALVTEWRTIDVPAGESRIVFQGVADGIVPQTAALDGLPAEFLERNQDYDLLSAGSLIDRAVGQSVTRIRTNRKTGATTSERAVLRSGPTGVVLEIDGRFEALHCGGDPERLVFDEAPPGLSDRPTLSMRVRAGEAGRYPVRLTYLAVGLDWAANYVAKLNPDGQTLDLTGWITLTNNSGASFANAPTAVVAGHVERDAGTVATAATVQTVEPRCWPMDTTTRGRRLYAPAALSPAPAPMGGALDEIMVTAQRRSASLEGVPIAVSAVQSELGDYKLYTLGVPTTVAARQTKQVMMVRRDGVRYDRFYVYGLSADSFDPDDDVEPQIEGAQILLRFKNTPEQGLGLPLPGGRVSVMEPDPTDGELLLAGRGLVQDSPVGLPMQLYLSEAPSVQVTPRLVRRWKVGKRQRDQFEIAVVNGKSVPIAFQVLSFDQDQGFRIVSESRRRETIPGGRAWTVHLAPGETQTIKITTEKAI